MVHFALLLGRIAVSGFTTCLRGGRRCLVACVRTSLLRDCGSPVARELRLIVQIWHLPTDFKRGLSSGPHQRVERLAAKMVNSERTCSFGLQNIAQTRRERCATLQSP